MVTSKDKGSIKMKIGVNDACYCGSGKKYKKCHQGREKEIPLHPKEFNNQLRRSYQKKVCLHPTAPIGCGSQIINAHTIQRSGAISKIVDSTNHVLTFYPPETDAKGKRIIHSRGWKEASTFKGFCNTHDTSLFADLETQPFTGNAKQCFLVGYRAVCHEKYQKRAVNDNTPLLKTNLDKGLAKADQISIQTGIKIYENGTQTGAKEVNEIKNLYDSALQTNDFTDINYAVISFDGDISVVSTGIVSPDFDVNGNRLQNIADFSKEVEALTFGVVSTVTGGAFVISWLSKFKICSNFVNLLLSAPIDKIPSLLVEFMFAYVENTYFSKTWWDLLDQSKRDRLTHLATLFSGYGGFWRYSRIKFTNWQITNITKNIK